MDSPSEERRDEPAKEMTHKTKAIQFLGRTTPIILQNDNGPCPLLAICNVLLLKNNLNLSPEVPEVSQEKLLSLVAERLIDSNSDVNIKDVGYVENQQQNISDAIDLLPRLTTGIDVNIKFRRIDDFEFTPECAIFDLLDIPLYHGWIVDPQDYETANAIGPKSYNALMGELVALETRSESEQNKNAEEDSIDFVAATTATLGVPSPCLSRGISFDDSPCSITNNHLARNGYIGEEADQQQVLKLAETESPISQSEMETSVCRTVSVDTDGQNSFMSSKESACLKNFKADVLVETFEENIFDGNHKSFQQKASILDYSNASGNHNNDLITFETVQRGSASSSMPDQKVPFVHSISEEGNEPDMGTDLVLKTNSRVVIGQIPSDWSAPEQSKDHFVCKDVVEKTNSDALVKDASPECNSPRGFPSSACQNHLPESGGDVQVQNQFGLTVNAREAENVQCGSYVDFCNLSTPAVDSDSSSGRKNVDVSDILTSSIDGSEPIYEGEECIMESGAAVYEDREPMYEGEVVLAKQVDEGNVESFDANSKDEITPKQGYWIRNFLKNSASQLTVYGLFCLQDGLKERELCVFFRNNHFNTMFKYEGELYILATDQGYINQPDLVWEKLNEVNGDTLFMTGNFKEFKVDTSASTWDAQHAMASTAEYLAEIDNSTLMNSGFNSDLQLAIALQQQEFEQQPQHSLEQPSTVSGSSKLVTGPQVVRNNNKNMSKQDSKSSKEKCVVM